MNYDHAVVDYNMAVLAGNQIYQSHKKMVSIILSDERLIGYKLTSFYNTGFYSDLYGEVILSLADGSHTRMEYKPDDFKRV